MKRTHCLEDGDTHVNVLYLWRLKDCSMLFFKRSYNVRGSAFMLKTVPVKHKGREFKSKYWHLTDQEVIDMILPRII